MLYNIYTRLRETLMIKLITEPTTDEVKTEDRMQFQIGLSNDEQLEKTYNTYRNF